MTNQNVRASRHHFVPLLAALALACSATAVTAGSNASDNATRHNAPSQHAIRNVNAPSATTLPPLPKVDAMAPTLLGQPYMHATVARVGANGQLQVLCVDDPQPRQKSQLQHRADAADTLTRVR